MYVLSGQWISASRHALHVHTRENPSSLACPPVQSMVFITLLLSIVAYIFAVVGVIFFGSASRSPDDEASRFKWVHACSDMSAVICTVSIHVLLAHCSDLCPHTTHTHDTPYARTRTHKHTRTHAHTQTHTHTHTHAHTCTHAHTHTHVQESLRRPHCLVSAFHP